MLLKPKIQAQKRIKAAGKPQRTTGGMVKLSAGVTVVPKIHRRVIKVASKRPSLAHRNLPLPVKREHISFEACDNSNDSGLGFDHHLTLASHSAELRLSEKEQESWRTNGVSREKRQRLEIKLESDETNENFSFPESVRQQPSRPICMPVRNRPRVVVPQSAVTLTSQLSSVSHNGLVHLVIACQPEQQHRARYQTEGSRGAVKDRTGNGFPVVKLVGYDRPATLQVFIGTDQGRVAPHMFYQACRVSGKNSTPCVEKKVDGTIVIEVDVEPAKDMVVTCDCVGILKERNVDVEHRFPEEGTGRSKKKSTRCRMVFRTTITNADGSQETLQVTSQQIVCTQPPGIPEICRQSVMTSFVDGGGEMFIIGKNFLKDTKVLFDDGDSWKQVVQPDKEFLHQSHLVCTVPPYKNHDITQPVSVKVIVESSGKASEPRAFIYMPRSVIVTPDGYCYGSQPPTPVAAIGHSPGHSPPNLPGPPALPLLMPTQTTFIAPQSTPRNDENPHPVMLWEKTVDLIMPPPLAVPRRSSIQMIVPDQITPADLKREIPDTVIDASIKQQMINGSDLSNTRSPSMDTIRRFVSNTSLPTINVSSYLSNIEGHIVYSDKTDQVPLTNELTQVMPVPVSHPVFSNDSSNLLTTVNQSASLSLTNRNLAAESSVQQHPQENLSVIVSSSLVPKTNVDNLDVPNTLHCKEVTRQQESVGMDILSSFIKKQAAEITERLDAFVNSTAESHISPNPEAPISMSPVLDETTVANNEASNSKTTVPCCTPVSTIPITSSEASLSYLLTDTKPNHDQTSMQANLDRLRNQNIEHSHTDINSILHSVPLGTTTNAQALSDLKASLEEQLSQTVTSNSPSQITCSGLNNLMASDNSHLQRLVDIQANLSQPGDLTASTNRSELVQTLHSVSHQRNLDSKLSPQDLSTSQIERSNFSGLIPTASQDLQATLVQHLTPQPVSSSQLSHPECIHPSMDNMASIIHTSPRSVATEAQALSNLKASLSHHLSTQIMEQVQNNLESLADRNLAPQTCVSESQELSSLEASISQQLTSQILSQVQTKHESLLNRNSVLNTSLSNSPECPHSVSPVQNITNMQTSIGHHLSSQAMDAPQPIIEPMSRLSNPQNSLNCASEVTTSGVNHNHCMNNLHLSLEHMTSCVLTPTQQAHDTMASSTLVTNSQIQSTVSQSQVMSGFQTLGHHLTNQVMHQAQTSPQPVLTMDGITNTIQISPRHSPNHSIPGLNVSLEQFSPQSVNAGLSNVAPNNLTLNNSHQMDMGSNISLISPQASEVGSVILSSPASHQSATSILTSPGMSMSNTPTMSLSPAGLNMHNPQPLEITRSDLAMDTSPGMALNRLQQRQQTGLNQFEHNSSNMTRYEQHHDIKQEKGDMFGSQNSATQGAAPSTQQQPEETLGLTQQLTQMSEHDLIRYINPSCFDSV